MKTAELIGSALNWAVAKCDGNMEQYDYYRENLWLNSEAQELYAPSSDWAQGGPIIEWEGISLEDPCNSDIDAWRGFCGGYQQYGPTPLVAAMRAYVASKLGDEVEIPKELAQ